MADSTSISRDEFRARLEDAAKYAIVPNEGLFGPQSVTWSLLRESVGFLGGGRAALLQVAHPWVANGVDQHSKTKTDPLGRFHRTFENVLTILFGSLDQVVAVSDGLNRLHAMIVGKVPDATAKYHANSKYFANHVDAMMWVHATLWETFVTMHELVLGPIEAERKEAFYQEIKRFALCFGVPFDRQPAKWADFEAYNREMWASQELGVGAAGLEVRSYLFRSKKLRRVELPLKVIEIVTAETMPPRFREEFRLPPPSLRNRAIFKSTIAAAKVGFAVAPPRVRYSPVYFEAMDRVAGKPGSDRETKRAIKLMLGRTRLVSNDAQLISQDARLAEMQAARRS